MTRFQKAGLLVGITLAVFALARLLLYLAYYGTFSHLPAGSVALAFGHGIRFDLSILLTFIGLPLVMLCLPFAFADGRRWHAAWCWVIFAVADTATLILASDLVYFHYVYRHVASELLTIDNDMNAPLTMMFTTYLPYTAIFAAFSAGLFLLWRKIVHVPMQPPRLAWLQAAALALLIVIGTRGSFSHKALGIIDAFTTADTQQSTLTLNGFFTLYHSMISSGKQATHAHLTEGEAAELVKLDYENDADPRKLGIKEGAAGRPRNVVLFALESWNTHYVDSFGGNGFKVTPTMDALAARGLQFVSFYAVAQRSSQGIQAMLTGVPPLAGMPVLGFGLEMYDVPKIGQIVKDRGYSTVFVQSSKRQSYRMDSVARATGFDAYYGCQDIPMLLRYPAGPPQFGWDYETLLFLKKKLDDTRQPFLGFVFTGTTHSPYVLAGKEFERYPHSVDGPNGFLNTLYYSDWCVGRFMEEARKMPWFDDTIFVFTADHAAGSSRGFAEEFHVPLVIYAPKLFAPRRIETIGSQIDLMPTILHMIGIEATLHTAGRSLFNKPDEFAWFSDEQTVGIISRQGYVRHSGVRRLEAKAANGAVDPACLDRLEKKLLAFGQVTYGMLKERR